MKTQPTLNNLKQVVVTNPVADDVLSYNGTNWVNAALSIPPPAPSGPITWDNVATNLYGPGTALGGTNNTVYGNNSLSANTIGSNNVVIGNDALQVDSYPLRQIAIGVGALQNYQTPTWLASDIVSIGDEVVIVSPGTTDFTLCGALNNNPGTIFTVTDIPTGNGTIAGVEYFLPTVAIGYGALQNNSPTENWEGGSNLAIGYKSLHLTTSGYYNTAIGSYTLYSNTTGYFNTAIGPEVLFSNTTGYNNTAVGGYNVLYSNTTGSNNIAVGNNTLYFNTTGSNNIAVGDNTLNSNTAGTDNIAVGSGALYLNTGNYNIAIGSLSGTDITTGNNNTIIGTLPGTSNLSSTVLIGAGTTERIKVDDTGLYINGSLFTGSAPKQNISMACSDETTALTVGLGKITFRMPYAFTLTEVRASLTVAQSTGSIFTVNVRHNGTSIFSTNVTIDNTEKSSVTAAIPNVITTTTLVDDAEIIVDIDQIGDGTAKGLKVYLIGYAA